MKCPNTEQNKSLVQIIREGEKHAEDRDELHALYEEALAKQQATRTFLRKAAKKEMGKFSSDGFSKHPELEVGYSKRKEPGKSYTTGGWAVKWGG